MDDEAERAIEQAKRLLEDAAIFHLKSIPLPVAVVSKLVDLAERWRIEEAGSGSA